MTKKSELKERANDAVRAYLERSGMQVIESDSKKFSPIFATDDDVLVHVTVSLDTEIVPSLAYFKRCRREMKAYLNSLDNPEGVDYQIRFDQVNLKIIAEDRALLRHQRAITGGS